MTSTMVERRLSLLDVPPLPLCVFVKLFRSCVRMDEVFISKLELLSMLYEFFCNNTF